MSINFPQTRAPLTTTGSLDVGSKFELSTCVDTKISDSTVAHLLATNTNHHYVKCIDIYPQPEPDILLAVGQANGKVVLTTFGPTVFDSQGLSGKELGEYPVNILMRDRRTSASTIYVRKLFQFRNTRDNATQWLGTL